MKNKLLFYFAILLVISSLIFPFILESESMGIPIDKILESFATVGSIIVVALMIVNHFLKKQSKGCIYLAYDYRNSDFVNTIKEVLSKLHYVCLPNNQIIANGSNIKNLKLETQFEKADMLIVILSEDDTDQNYINLTIRSFSRMNKPIQIFCRQRPINLPHTVKPYIIFTLPREEKTAVNMIVRFVFSCMSNLNIRKNKN